MLKQQHDGKFQDVEFKNSIEWKKTTIKTRFMKYSKTPTGKDGGLGDVVNLENELFDKNKGGDFDAMKNVTHNTNDQTLKLLNTNVSTENYKQNPFYKLIENLKFKGNQYEYIVDTIKNKIQNRTLSQDDYELFYDEKNNQIRLDPFERYGKMVNSYQEIGASLYMNHNSEREIIGNFKNKRGAIGLSKHVSFKSTLEHLENNYAVCNNMYLQGINELDIGLYLSNKNYSKVIDIKKKLGVCGLFYFSNSNNTYSLWSGSGANTVAEGNTLQEMIDDFVSKQRLFDQKDKVISINLGKLEEFYGNSEKMQYVWSQYKRYYYLNDFWRGENNAQAGFNKPSSVYGLKLMSTFDYLENDTSARIILNLMKNNGNEREIKEDLMKNATKNNLLDCKAIKIENGIVRFTEQALKKIINTYEREKVSALEELDELQKFFDDNKIILPNEKI